MTLTVVTYGGGEILNNIFNAIAILMNNNSDGLVRPLMILCASIGGFWALSKAFFSASVESLFLKYYFPLLIVTGLFFIPTTSVHIEDVLKDRSYKVDHVPLALAKFSELVSTIGYKFTVIIEKTMHVPNDTSYNSTGMIFGAESAMDLNKYQISNGDLEQNLRRFAKQCVVYDIALGKYSIDEMKKATDLWKFFEEKTSNVRMISYCPPNHKGSKTCTYLTCKESVRAMTPYFESEISYCAKQDILKSLPLTFQALTGLQRDKEELISQQLVMNLLKGEFSDGKFATNRAYTQQKSTYLVLGALASGGLLAMRAVFEALVYSAFIFVIPLSLLPGGFRIISTWAWLAVWIQLWPPFYAILSYVMQTVAQGQAEGIFYGLTEAQRGLSLFTSVGLLNLHEDIFALAGYLSASVPFISYAILKGGMSSFVQLAGSLMSPSQGAAASAASEQVTGNYSFANTSFGQTSYKNATGFQANLAPSLSSGYFTDNQGNESAVYGQGEVNYKQSNSDLRTSLFTDEGISKSFQQQYQHAQSSLDTTQKNYLDSISAHSRNFADMNEHLSKSSNYSVGVSEREAYDVSESARYVQNVAENWGKQYGLNARDSMQAIISTSIGGGVGFGSFFNAEGKFAGQYDWGASREQMLSSALNVTQSEDFQKNLQKVSDFSESKGYSSLNDEGIRLSSGYNNSLDQMKSYQESYQIAQSNLNQVSETAAWVEQNSHLIKKSLNQDFVNWGSERIGSFSQFQDVISNGSELEKQEIVQEFLSYIKAKDDDLFLPEKFDEPNTHYQQANINNIDVGSEFNLIQSKRMHGEDLLGFHREEFNELGANLSVQKDLRAEDFEQKATIVGDKYESQHEKMIDKFSHKNEKSLFTRGILQGPNKASNLASKYQMSEEPFWMKEE